MDTKINYIAKVPGGILVILEDGREAMLDQQAVVKLAELTHAFERLDEIKQRFLDNDDQIPAKP